jgi:hypothetical protein
MVMSSLIRRFHGQRAVYAVQSGVVAWDDPEPIANWTSKTVTVCAGDAALLTALLREVLDAEVVGRKSVFRCHVSTIPASQSAPQRRRLSDALHADPPGFVGTVVTFSDAVAVSVATASGVRDIELAYLSSYRQTFLIATEDVGITPAAISEILLSVSLPLDGKAISKLRIKYNTFVVIRALEEENQYVFQIICDPATSESITKLMAETGLHRVADRVTASQAIGAIPKTRS